VGVRSDGARFTDTHFPDLRAAAIPSIALALRVMLETVKKAIEWVCDDYDIKPVEFQRLLEKIETALADKKRL
jgi:CheY-like chemotaxis protein